MGNQKKNQNNNSANKSKNRSNPNTPRKEGENGNRRSLPEGAATKNNIADKNSVDKKP